MSKKRTIILSSVFGVLIGILISGSLFAYKVFLHGKFAPGTSIAGIDLSYKTPQQSKDLIAEASQNYLNTPIKLKLSNTEIELTPKDLGIDVLVDKTVEILDQTDATKVSLSELLPLIGPKDTTINILTSIDHEKLLEMIDDKFQLSRIKPRVAAFYLDLNTQLEIRDERAGFMVNEQQLIADIKNSAKQLDSEKIELELVRVTPKISREVLENERSYIETALRHEMALLDPIYSDDWYIKLIDHLDWVSFTNKEEFTMNPFQEVKDFEEEYEQDAERDYYTKVIIDENKLNAFIDAEISQWLDVPAEPVNIYTDENEQVVIEGRGSNGLEVQRKLLKQSMELAAMHQVRDVPIPVLEVEPTITVSNDLQKLGIKDVVGIGHTSYYGSPANRLHNIKVGASKFNGKLIAPGEVFSFNTNLGAVDGSTGYRKELVIKKEGTIPEYGGGLCQVSTTMFRTVLLSGLPIVERNPHSYAVSYYSQVLGHGLDATIYLGGSDLKFENDTDHHLLVQTYTKDDYELYIVFYGTSDGRSVELEGPYLSNYHSPGATQIIQTTSLAPGARKQVEIPHTGFNALWYRHITDGNGQTEIEPINTRYRAVPAKILVGIDPNPTPALPDPSEGPTI